VRIVLTIPPVEDIPSSRPPLALGYLAACLKDAGHEPIIRDYGLTPHMPVEEAATAVCREEPEVVGISTWTPRLAECLDMARCVKSGSPAFVVLGGPHPTVRPIETLAHEGVDAVVIGETEQTFVDMVDRMAAGEPLAGIAGIAFKQGTEIRRNEPRPPCADIDRLPFPDRDALQVADYPLRLHSGEPMTNMITSRGHPQKSVHGFSDPFGKEYRARNAESVIEEIESIVQDYGIRAVSFDDPGFTFDQPRLRRIIDLVESRDLVVRWECTALVDVLAEEDYARMAHAGCAAIRFNNLTGNPVAIERMGYNVTMAQVRDAVAWCKKVGIRTKGSFLTGLPEENRRDIEQTAAFAVELDLDEACFSIAVPMPGSALWTTAVETYPELADSRQYPGPAHVRVGPTQQVFANLSALTDSDLVEATTDAYDIFWKRVTRRRQFNERFGPELGEMIWRISLLTRFKPVRALKRTIMRPGRRS